MTKTVSAARQPDAAQAGAGAAYRNRFGSFGPDKDGRIFALEVLPRLERSGPDQDPCKQNPNPRIKSYRGIRATTEQTSARTGLDHHGRACLGHGRERLWR
jgi:hypothetical protein